MPPTSSTRPSWPNSPAQSKGGKVPNPRQKRPRPTTSHHPSSHQQPAVGTRRSAIPPCHRDPQKGLLPRRFSRSPRCQRPSPPSPRLPLHSGASLSPLAQSPRKSRRATIFRAAIAGHPGRREADQLLSQPHRPRPCRRLAPIRWPRPLPPGSPPRLHREVVLF